jgi:flagellar basal body rod protein FlgG
MQITGSSYYTSALTGIQTGLNRLDQAASQVANTAVERSATSQSSDYQAERLRSVDRSQVDPASASVEMIQAQISIQAAVKVEKAADAVLGSLLDTYA